jgi:hypothetical protein
MAGELNFNRVIKNMDLFGQGIELRIDKFSKSKTIFGGLLTIIMIFMLFFMFYITSQDVFNKTNPKISLEQQVNKELSPLNLDKNTFPLSFSLMINGNFAIYKPNYFNYYISRRYGKTTDPALIEDFYNITQCRKEFFPKVTQEEYDKLNMNQNLCVEDQNITLAGGWNSDYISYLSLRIAICTGSDQCAPYEEIVDFIQSNTFFWNLFYMNTNINPQNFTDPISYNIFNYYKLAKLGSFKLTELFIRPQTLKSDNGFIFQSISHLNSLSYDFDNYDDSAIDDSLTLVDFEFLVSPNIFIYHRNYIKIQEVLASVGGLANLLRILFVILCYTFSIVKRDEIILNKLFEFDLNQKKSLLMYATSKINNKNIKDQKASIDFVEDSNNKLKNFSKENSTNVEFIETPKKVINSNSPKKKKALFSNSKDDYILSPQKNFIPNNSEQPKSFKFTQSPNRKSTVPLSIDPSKMLPEKNLSEAKKMISLLEKRNTRNQLKFTFCEIVLGFICCSFCINSTLNTKRKLYKKSKILIEEFLDITFIFHKLEEFEKFKLTAFSAEQLALFNFISKELISLDNKKTQTHYMTLMKNFNKDKENLVNLIIQFKEKMKNNEELDSVDKKLFDFINDEFK